MNIQDAKDEQEKNIQIIRDVQEYFIVTPDKAKLITQLHSNKNHVDEVKKKIMDAAREQFRIRGIVDAEQMQKICREFEEYMWGYSVIRPLLDDKRITDIATYAKDHITVKTVDGKRYSMDKIRFPTEKDYKSFIHVIALRNEVNLSSINAQQVFTDNNGHPDFKLRIDISTELVNSSGMPYMHIRKSPKSKYSTEDLVEMGAFSSEQMNYLINRFNYGQGMLIIGENNSAKTTLLNALLDKMHRNNKMLISQETDELYTNHPDALFQHLVKKNGEGGVSYSLGDLIEKGLVSDINMFIIGEIKEGSSAASLLKGSFTGGQVATTVHGPSLRGGIEKLGDYVMEETRYTFEETMRFLRTFETLVFMKDRKCIDIGKVTGWNAKKKQLDIETIHFPEERKSYELSDFCM